MFSWFRMFVMDPLSDFSTNKMFRYFDLPWREPFINVFVTWYV